MIENVTSTAVGGMVMVSNVVTPVRALIQTSCSHTVQSKHYKLRVFSSWDLSHSLSFTFFFPPAAAVVSVILAWKEGGKISDSYLPCP